MPFANNVVKDFDRLSIESINPNQIGVYGIYRDGRWIYVGRGDIRARMLDHLNGDILCIQRERATKWVFEVTNNSEARERELILEMEPACNQRAG